MEYTLQPASTVMPTPNSLPIIRNLPQITVHTKNGIGFTADNLSLCIFEGYHALSFISSGNLIIVLATEVESISYDVSGCSYCTHCQ